MKYTINATTKRYSANSKCSYDEYSVKVSDKYQFGCEFEFYIDTTSYDFTFAIESIIQEIYEITHVEILVDIINLPVDSDKNNCMQIKPDISLADNGIEISVPITTQAGIKHFIQTICPIIEKYGYTNEETGFHIHISTINNDGINFNFYKYMLLCDNAGLLSSWEPRIGYSQNVMDILASNSKQVSRKIKTKKGTVWNLEKVDANHIEIKSIGGKNYHHREEVILLEFSDYVQYFEETLQRDTDAHKQMYTDHKIQIENVSKEISSQFASALNEAGIV